MDDIQPVVLSDYFKSVFENFTSANSIAKAYAHLMTAADGKTEEEFIELYVQNLCTWLALFFEELQKLNICTNKERYDNKMPEVFDQCISVEALHQFGLLFMLTNHEPFTYCHSLRGSCWAMYESLKQIGYIREVELCN